MVAVDGSSLQAESQWLSIVRGDITFTASEVTTIRRYTNMCIITVFITRTCCNGYHHQKPLKLQPKARSECLLILLSFSLQTFTCTLQ